MDNCEKHKKDLYGETDMKKVAEDIGDLHYETLNQLLSELSVKICQDSERDADSGKIALSNFLWDAHTEIYCAAYKIKKAWQISEPFMKS